MVAADLINSSRPQRGVLTQHRQWGNTRLSSGESALLAAVNNMWRLKQTASWCGRSRQEQQATERGPGTAYKCGNNRECSGESALRASIINIQAGVAAARSNLINSSKPQGGVLTAHTSGSKECWKREYPELRNIKRSLHNTGIYDSQSDPHTCRWRFQSLMKYHS